MLTLLLLSTAHAAEVGGYFRLMARPDLVGGDGRLGTSAFYGRLLNEGPWGLLDLRQRLVTGGPGVPWGDLRLRVEGGTVANGEASNGSLLGFRLSQLHLHAGNLGPADVEWRFGTLETTFGDIGLYDTRPSQMWVDVLGAQATWSHAGTEVAFALGDSGWALRGSQYHLVASGGVSVKHTVGDHLKLGLGGQAWVEPPSDDPDALQNTPGLSIRDWYGDRADWAANHPDAAAGEPVLGLAWKLAGSLDFLKLGAIRSNRFQVVAWRRLPDAPVVTAVGDTSITLGAADHTDARYALVIGNEMEVEVLPERLELAWGILYDRSFDLDDRPDSKGGGSTGNNRAGISTVVRAQLALTPTVALLGESCVAYEVVRGETPTDTQQAKGGVVLSPAGPGLNARPALRLLYGVQHSSKVDAWPGTPTGSHWHHVASLEAEAWF